MCNLIAVNVLIVSCCPNKSLGFITNGVKGIQSSKKKLKLMQSFKDKQGPAGVLFLH